MTKFYYIQLRRNEQSIENYAFYVMDSDSQITLESVDNVLSQQEYYLGCYCIAQKQNIYAQDTKGNVTADVIISDSSLENIIIVFFFYTNSLISNCNFRKESIF